MKRFSCLAILLSLCFNLFSQELPKREFRGAWLHIIGNATMRSMTSEQVQKMLRDNFDALAKMGCNAVILQVRPQADAFYKSDIEPWTRYLTGVQGKAPSPFWDPLEFAVEEAHKRGMELHAWLNPYRVTSSTKDVLATDHISFREPWRFVRYGNQIYFDPGIPDNIDYLVKIIKDIVGRYDIDAIHFDDYFYPYPIRGSEFPDDASFSKYGSDFLSKDDWRRDNCTRLVSEVNSAIKSIKPWVRFGISPFGIHRNKFQDPDGSDTKGLSTFDALYADIPFWVTQGYIDYYVPQLYWKIGHALADYKTLIRWWNDSDFGDHLYIGQSISTFSEPDVSNPSTTQMAAKMKLVRDLEHVCGNVWWPGWDLVKNVNEVGDSLRLKYQKYPALVPAYRNLDEIAPEPVVGFRVGGRSLIWESVPTLDPLQMPFFFVVYRFPADVPVDIGDNRYIYKITREKSISIPSGASRFKYVVTVCDRCWNESAPCEPILL